MSLRERHRFRPINTLYFVVFLAMVTILSLSFIVFREISTRMESITITPTFEKFDELQLESARGIFNSGGTETLTEYLANLDKIFGGHHYLLDSDGIDLVSGESRAALLPPLPLSKWRVQKEGYRIIARQSGDGQYWFAVTGTKPPIPPWIFLPYYFLVIGATGVLCWLASVGVVSPIRRIATSIALFGQGDLSIRVPSKRQDEIGQLGHSFNEMAERLQRLIINERRLLADISHELRSPLARLKFAVKLARTSGDSHAALDRIERDVNRISSLVADIVDITFIEDDPAVQGSEIVRIEDLIHEVVKDCALDAQMHGCRIDLNGQLSGEILGSHELLRRAVENVLRNGIRYSPEQSTIEVLITKEAGAAKIAVRDFGPGVPEDALIRIFDPFFRVEEARDATGGGSGLGLSIAKRAIQVHQGTITAENASPGLRVRISVPLLKPFALN